MGYNFYEEDWNESAKNQSCIFCFWENLARLGRVGNFPVCGIVSTVFPSVLFSSPKGSLMDVPYTQIPNSFLEKMFKTQMSPSTWQLLICILRNTLGYKGKTQNTISRKKIIEETGLMVSTIKKARKKLKSLGFITTAQKNPFASITYKICFPVSGTAVVPLPKQQGCQHGTTVVVPPSAHYSGTVAVPHNKEKTKETNKEKEWLDYFNKVTNQQLPLTAFRKNLIATRLKDKTMGELKICADNFAKDTWPDRRKFKDIIYCIDVNRKGVDNLDRWLNINKKARQPYNPEIHGDICNLSK